MEGTLEFDSVDLGEAFHPNNVTQIKLTQSS